MNKYFYNLCVCVFGATLVLQADDTSGMNRSRNKSKQSTVSQKGRTSNSYNNSQKKSTRNSSRKSADDEFENDDDERNDDDDERNDDDRTTKKPTLSELKECSCVQEYIKLTKNNDDEEEDSATEKRLKKRNYKNDDEDEEEESRYSKNNQSKNNQSKNNGTSRNRRTTKQTSREDESWKHKKADISNSLEKYKMVPLLNKPNEIFGIKLAENSVSAGEPLDKNTSCDKEDKIIKKDRNESINHKRNYRMDQKESTKFRQDLEKYRQVYV